MVEIRRFRTAAVEDAVRRRLEGARTRGKPQRPAGGDDFSNDRNGSLARSRHGDCFAYALAVEHDEPLLYKGGDFKHTDVRSAFSS